MTSDSNSFEIQRWHSAEYVDSWMLEQDREEGRVSLRIKLVSLIPLEPEASIRVLDLGAGAGALSMEFLSRFPDARIVCQDFSELMLARGRHQLSRYAEPVTFIQSDLTTSDWAAAIPGTFDAVISSLVMHTVPSYVRTIFGQVFPLVKPGGCFLFVDSIAPPGPMVAKAYLKIRHTAQTAGIKTGRAGEKGTEELDHELAGKKQNKNSVFPDRMRNPLRATLTLANYLEWLKQAGFDEVDCLWKDLTHAVIGGFKHPE